MLLLRFYSSVFIGKHPLHIIEIPAYKYEHIYLSLNIMEDIRVTFQMYIRDGKGFVASANSVSRHCFVTGFYSRLYRIGTSSSFYIPAQRSDI